MHPAVPSTGCQGQVEEKSAEEKTELWFSFLSRDDVVKLLAYTAKNIGKVLGSMLGG